MEKYVSQIKGVTYDPDEYHQKYLDKKPGGYCHVLFEQIRWVANIDPQNMDGRGGDQ